VVALLAAAVCAVGVGLALTLLPRERGLWIPVVAGLGVLVLPLILGLAGLDYVEARNMLPLWLPLMTIVAAGLLLRGRGVGLAAVALLAALGLSATLGVALEPLWQRDDWRGLARALGPAEVPRAIVFRPGYADEALTVYRPDARRVSGPVAVREVALVATAGREIEQLHPTRPPRPRHPQVPGFREVRRDYADTYSVVVLRAPGPERVSREDLGAHWLEGGGSAVGVALERRE
jgi:hypothetical protein